MTLCVPAGCRVWAETGSVSLLPSWEAGQPRWQGTGSVCWVSFPGVPCIKQSNELPRRCLWDKTRETTPKISLCLKTHLKATQGCCVMRYDTRTAATLTTYACYWTKITHVEEYWVTENFQDFCLQVPLQIYSFVFLLNRNEFTIATVDSVALIWALTKRDAIWPLDVVSHQHSPPHAIEACFLNLSFVSPVRPVHEPERNRCKKTVNLTQT